ncbi:MAG: S8 family serine peptidase [Thermodesulfobacteriota bacterium]
MDHGVKEITTIFVKRMAFFPLSLLILFLSFQGEGFAQGKAINRERILSEMQTSGQARIIAQFSTPRIKELTAASQGHKGVVPGEKRSREKVRPTLTVDQTLSGEIAKTVDNVLAKLSGQSFTVNRRYETLPLITLTVSKATIDTLEKMEEVTAIYPDKLNHLPQTIKGVKSDSQASATGQGLILPQLMDTVNIIGAPAAWARGYTGKGWHVAILDTGFLTSHEFFYDKNFVEACFALGQYGQGDCPNGSDTMIGSGAAAQYPSFFGNFDHGTHIAGIVAGKKMDGSLNGVAKEADIIAVQVFSRIYDPEYEDYYVAVWDSDIIRGLDYVYSLRDTYSIAAVNLSAKTYLYDDQYLCDAQNGAIKTAIDHLRSVNIPTAIGTGNNGLCGLVYAPACISSAIGVGASTRSGDMRASFSCWHSVLQDLFAPGEYIYSCGGSSNTDYRYMTGTSVAAPHISGAWAILRQNRPRATVDELLSAINAKGVWIESYCPGGGSKARIQVDATLENKTMPWLQLLLEDG